MREVNRSRCIFCKQDSTTSGSVEHIVPESLGNKSHVLPRGIVCDGCNNYFASKVEKMFLESGAITALRFRESLPSKKGRIPSMSGILRPNYPVRVYRYSTGSPYVGVVDMSQEAFEHMLQKDRSEILFPASGGAPDDFLVSRLLGKIGIEAIAQRLMNYSGGVEYVVKENQFDLLRNHARYGSTRDWPYHLRRIYPPDRKTFDPDNKALQTIFEYDLLYTPMGELYFIIAIFGLELAINVGGPELEGYLEWLKKTDGVSPLYFGKNEDYAG